MIAQIKSKDYDSKNKKGKPPIISEESKDN